MEFHIGLVRSYDATTHTADVLLAGSMSRVLLNIPVSQHIPAAAMTAGTECAVGFFADGSHGLVVSTSGGLAPAPLDLDAWGPTLTIGDLIRGWGDDFFGDSLASQYTGSSAGAGSSGGLVNNAHGGWYRLTTGAAPWNSHRLWLGNAADGYATLDADNGWLILARLQPSHTTSIWTLIGASDAAENNFVHAGILDNTWWLRTRTGGGAVNDVPGATTNASMHRLCIKAYPVTGGRRVDFYADGTAILDTQVSVPTTVITPFAFCMTSIAASRYANLDFFGVIPLNLA